MPQRKRYTKQFKEEAIRLVNQEGVSLTQVAQDLLALMPTFVRIQKKFFLTSSNGLTLL